MKKNLLKINVLGIVCLAAACLLFDQKLYTLGTLDTTLTATDKSQFLNVTWNFDSGAYAKGYVTFNSGFSLGSDMTFGCNGVVCGNIALNGHILTLNSDMYLGKAATFVGPGSINPQGYSIYLLDSASVSGGTVHVVSSMTLVGGGNYFSFSGGGILEIDAGFFGSIHNTIFYNVSSSNFITHASAFFTNLFGVTFAMQAGGVFDLYLPNNIVGQTKFIGNGATVNVHDKSIVQAASSLYIGPNTILRGPAGCDIQFVNSTSDITFDGGTIDLHVSNQWQFGRMIIQGNSTVKTNGYSLILGDGISLGNDIDLVIFPGAMLSVDDRSTIQYLGRH